jgi:hypothetical protein
MENINEEIKRIQLLMKSKNDLVNSLFEQEGKNKEEEDRKKEEEILKKRKEEENKKKESEITKKRKEEEKNKEKEIEKNKGEEEDVVKSLEDELWDFDCDMDVVLELDDFLKDSYIDDVDINKIKRLVVKIVKSC